MEWIDLDLPSGNLWADTNGNGLNNCLYTYPEAIKEFKESIPGKWDFIELLETCTHKFNKETGCFEFYSRRTGQMLSLQMKGKEYSMDTFKAEGGYYCTLQPVKNRFTKHLYLGN